MVGAASNSWLRVRGSASLELESALDVAVSDLIDANKFTRDEIEYISNYRLTLLQQTVGIQDKRLERIRSLCGLWDIQLKGASITSHRPLVGPFIVAAKRLIFPFLRVALADLIRQQRAFNSEALALLAEISAERKGE